MNTTKPLFIPIAPHDDETLLSMISRSAEANVHPRLEAFLRLADIETLRPAFVPFTKIEHAISLARRIGLSLDEVTRRMHPVTPEYIGCVDWYGTPMPRRLIDAETFRFSPKSLKRAPFQRTSWMLKPLTVCPDSMEELLVACSCGRTQKWRYRSSMDICERCRAPLTDAKSSELHAGLRRPMAHIGNLVSTSSDTRLDALESFPKPFRTWEAGELFASIVELGAILHNGDDLLHEVKNGGFSAYKVGHLAAGYEFVRNWPDSLTNLVSNSLDFTKGYSLARCVGPLSRYFSRSAAPTKLCATICSTVQTTLREMAIVPTRFKGKRVNWIHTEGIIAREDAATKFKVDKTIVYRLNTDPAKPPLAACFRGKDMLDEAMVANSITYLQKSRTAYECSLALGIPEYVVEALARRGMLTAVADRDAITMARESLYEDASLVDLMHRLGSVLKRSDAEGIRVVDMLRRHLHPEDWVDVVGAVVEQRLIVAMSVKSSLSFADSVVPHVEAERFLKGLPSRAIPRDAWVHCRAAAKLLGLHEISLGNAIKQGFLEKRGRSGNRVQIPLSSVRAFSDTYIGGAQAAKVLCVDTRAVSRIMRNAGIDPAGALSGTLIWYRRDIKKVSARAANH